MKSPAFSAAFVALASTLLVSTSSAQNKPVEIGPVYPAGSCTYFAVSTVFSAGPLETEILPATVKNCRRIQVALDRLSRPAQTTKPDPASTPPTTATPTSSTTAKVEEANVQDNEPRPLATFIQTYTITVWSDGRIEHGPVIALTQTQLDAIQARVEDQEPEHDRYLRVVKPKPKPASNVKPSTPGQHAAGERCHAATATGTRCTRLAKGTTGFCWQHQTAADNGD